MHLGDFDTSAVIYGKFTTYRPSTGATFTLGGTPALSVYKDNSTTQSTTGVTLTADFDAVTGLNHFAIDTSTDGAFYSAGSFFDIVITTGTVDSVSVTGAVVGRFTLRKNSALKPATAGRTLVVDATGLADANTVKLGPTGAGTAQTARDIGASVIVASGTVTTVTNQLTAAQIATGVWQDTTAGDFTVASSIGKSLYTTGNAPGAASGLALVGSNMGTVSSVTGSVASIAVGGITATSFAADAIDATAIAATGANEIRDAVWAKVLSELTVDPGATPAVSDAVMLPYMAIRNRRETDSTGGTDKIFNSAGATILTAAVSDSGTLFVKAKYA
jgi:hypothetical protein